MTENNKKFPVIGQEMLGKWQTSAIGGPVSPTNLLSFFFSNLFFIGIYMRLERRLLKPPVLHMPVNS